MINLKMQAQSYPDTQSRNVIADITGSSAPEKTVVISGHIDSWDVGQGAMDDGGGIFISWTALKLLKHLGLRPRRTVRWKYVSRFIEGINHILFIFASFLR